MHQKPKKSFSIDDLKNVNRTLLKSSRIQDVYLDNDRGRGDDDYISIEEEIDNEPGSEAQLDSLCAWRHSSISTVEDLSTRVKSQIVQENCSRENGSVKAKIQVKYWLHFTKHCGRITASHHFRGQNFLWPQPAVESF